MDALLTTLVPVFDEHRATTLAQHVRHLLLSIFPNQDVSVLLGALTAIIKHPAMQRLQFVAQLGCCVDIAPGHRPGYTRLYHSLQATCSAAMALHALRACHAISPDNQQQVLFEVLVASLMHDIGHGICSHSFEHVAAPQLLADARWTHEEQGERLVQLVLHDLQEQLRQLLPWPGPVSASRICDMISGRCDEWWCQVLCNQSHGLDIDMLTYLEEDTQRLLPQPLYMQLAAALRGFGCQPGALFTPIIQGMRVMEGQVCWDVDLLPLIFFAYRVRYCMYCHAYQDAGAKAQELMLMQAIVAVAGHAACPSTGVLSSMLLPGHELEFIREARDEHVKQVIRAARAEEGSPSQQGLQQAQQLVARIDAGRLWHPLCEVSIQLAAPAADWEDRIGQQLEQQAQAAITPQLLVSMLQQAQVDGSWPTSDDLLPHINETSLHLYWFKADHKAGFACPLDRVPVYGAQGRLLGPGAWAAALPQLRRQVELISQHHSWRCMVCRVYLTAEVAPAIQAAYKRLVPQLLQAALCTALPAGLTAGPGPDSHHIRQCLISSICNWHDVPMGSGPPAAEADASPAGEIVVV